METIITTSEGQTLNLNQYLNLVDVEDKEMVTELFNYASIHEIYEDQEMEIGGGDEFYL